MSNVLTNQLETKSYTLFLSSADKISGTNNQATFNINWDDFLPREYDTYKMTFSFNTVGGYYKDIDFSCTSSSMTAGGTTLTITSGLTGVVAPGQLIGGSAGIANNTFIVSQLTGTGGTGTYQVSKPFLSTLPATSTNGFTCYTGCKIVMDSLGRSYSFDTAKMGQSSTLGYSQRDIQTSTSTSNSFSTFYLDFPPKTINRPNQNLITISIFNTFNNFLLVDTNKGGTVRTDMSNWNLILEFTPVQNSVNALKKD